MQVKFGRETASDAPAAALLLGWYDRHARALPWRVSPAAFRRGARPDPYRVWLSEVMLQQTTVAAVKSYFERFTSRWPSVEALAQAPADEVMAAWAGLGYYARARNLHACAKAVAAEHGGRFPRTAEGLKRLPGIGDYTGAAIAAIAFGERVAVVDGNVERVVSRLHAIEIPLPKSRPAIRAHVDAMTPASRPGDFAQAMMDLGATICTPRRPACAICPVRPLCTAQAKNEQDRFPVKLPKRAKPARRGAAFVAVRRSDGAVWLRRRPEAGMLGGMAEPPTTGWSAKGDGATGAEAAPFPAAWAHRGVVSHGFTHFDLALDVWHAVVDETGETMDGWWSPPGRIGTEALPTLMRRAIALATERDGKPA
ncbi:A/G-specific adenine glycosylase [Aureimonas leprariae]|uniref:Adenine DNA glycosylase n=1 Tax=Plantimonas leprariae TaxID=2615207 RepID=A0A7V7PP01_9HYPH|nr:A/G-specific adenine glycosylase [Aureimonas leprariae]KAB0679562.1 A/G-specific adenine glycosylase [Aureimonas leprariae]